MGTPGERSDDALREALAAERTRSAELEQALMSSRQIGMAIGVVMERYRIAPDAAFGVLQRLSQSGNVKLRDIAEDFLATGRLPVAADDLGRPSPN